jgi:hypothetical protein
MHDAGCNAVQGHSLDPGLSAYLWPILLSEEMGATGRRFDDCTMRITCRFAQPKTTGYTSAGSHCFRSVGCNRSWELKPDGCSMCITLIHEMWRIRGVDTARLGYLTSFGYRILAEPVACSPCSRPYQIIGHDGQHTNKPRIEHHKRRASKV